MYHIEHAKLGFHEVNFAKVWRGIANCSHKFVVALIKAREREVSKILAQYQKDHPSVVHK